MRITDSKENIKGLDFSPYEFFKVSRGGEFDLPDALIMAQQWLRNYFQQAWSITSTYRPDDTFGFHRYGCAVDSVPLAASNRHICLDHFKEECINYVNGNESELISNLRKIGVNGFGVEGTCIHLDIRPEKDCAYKDNKGSYIVFTYSPEKGSGVIYPDKSVKK